MRSQLMLSQGPVAQGHDRLVRRLEAIGELGKPEKRAIYALPLTTRIIAAHHDVFREGDRLSACCLVIEGFVHGYKMLQDGRRQIVSLHIPGDMPDLHGLHLRRMDHSLAALAVSEVAFIPHAALLDALESHPSLMSALSRTMLVDASVFREWIANLGARSASQRIAHLLCELYLRCRAVGLAEGRTFRMPVTQAEMGDATGLSTVHVNRTLQDLRAGGLISTQGRFVQILDWRLLQRAGGFDPGYLHLADAAVPA